MKMLSWSRYHYRSWLSSCVVRRRHITKAQGSLVRRADSPDRSGGPEAANVDGYFKFLTKLFRTLTCLFRT